MSDTLTLIQLRTRVRERADMVNSTFVTDSELNGYINYSCKALWDLLTEAAEDYGTINTTSTISSGNTITLPADFYKLRGVDDMSQSNPRTVRKFNWNERNEYTNELIALNAFDYSDVYYRVTGNTLLFEPPENALKTFRVWYVPKFTDLAADGDTADGVQGWLEFAVVDSAIKCLIKEESDTTVLAQERGNLVERISRMRHNRDQALPEKVSRIRNRNRSGICPYDGGGIP